MIRALALTALVAACAQPKYDADLGVSGVPVDSGALEGTFARIAQAADIAQIPALGDRPSGGQTFTLVARLFDGQRYQENDRVCGVVDFDVAGLHTAISDHTARSVPPFAAVVDVDHGAGTFASDAYHEIWGWSGSGAVPTEANDPRVDDMDGDGHPGATITASGLASGEVYIAQRKTMTLTGVVRSKDESFGLVVAKKEAAILDATSPLLKSSATRHPDPNPKQSWWHEVRLTDDASCDDVVPAVGDTRPF